MRFAIVAHTTIQIKEKSFFTDFLSTATLTVKPSFPSSTTTYLSPNGKKHPKLYQCILHQDRHH